jgi:Lipopolysaccharide-assembly
MTRRNGLTPLRSEFRARQPNRNPLFLWVFIGCACFSLVGCAGYNLGPVSGQTAGADSVLVRPFINATLEPHLTDTVTSQLRKQIQRDATFRLATHEDGDIVVSGTLIRYGRLELSFAPKDTLTVRDYRLSLAAKVKATVRSSGKVILDEELTGFTIISVNNDLTSSERQALPLLAGELAKTITSRLAEGTW